MLRARYLSGARQIAEIVLTATPSAAFIELDEYLDDETFDCGPVLSAEGNVLLDDATDLESGALIEEILTSWSRIMLSDPTLNWIGHHPESGALRVDLTLAAGITESPESI